VQTPVSISALDRPAFDRTQLCLLFSFLICCRFVVDSYIQTISGSI